MFSEEILAENMKHSKSKTQHTHPETGTEEGKKEVTTSNNEINSQDLDFAPEINLGAEISLIETSRTFRFLLDILHGVGRISSGDQSMNYKYNESRKSYQIKL